MEIDIIGIIIKTCIVAGTLIGICAVPYIILAVIGGLLKLAEMDETGWAYIQPVIERIS